MKAATPINYGPGKWPMCDKDELDLEEMKVAKVKDVQLVVTVKEVRAAVLQELYYTSEVIAAAQSFRDFFIDKYANEPIKCPYIQDLFVALKELEGYDTDVEIDTSD